MVLHWPTSQPSNIKQKSKAEDLSMFEGWLGGHDNARGPEVSQCLRADWEVTIMPEGWLGGHYNTRGPEVLFLILITISYIILHTLLYKTKKNTDALTVDILLFSILLWLSKVWLSEVWMSEVWMSEVWLSKVRLSEVWLSKVWLSKVMFKDISIM